MGAQLLAADTSSGVQPDTALSSCKAGRSQGMEQGTTAQWSVSFAQPGTPARTCTSGGGGGSSTDGSDSSSDGQCSPCDEHTQLRQPLLHKLSWRQQQPQQQALAGMLARALASVRRSEWTDHAHLAAVTLSCVCWVVVSSGAILINKHIMVDLSFGFPATVAALGMLGTTLASFVVCAVLRLVPCRATVSPYFYCTRILATGFFVALSFQAGNTAYLYLSVAFVQMLKAFTPVSTMLCSFAFGLEKPSGRLIAAVLLICCGVVVSSWGEVNFSLFGVAAMLTSIAAEGLRTVLMQHLLAAKQFHPLEAWMYLGPACSVWLLLLIGLSEAPHIAAQQGLAVVAAHPAYFACAALAGFAVNALAMLVIKLASALTLKVLGICKDIGLVLLGVAALGEHVAGLQVLGYSVSLVGFGAYNVVKMAASGIPGSGGPSGSCAAKEAARDAAAAAKAAAPRDAAAAAAVAAGRPADSSGIARAAQLLLQQALQQQLRLQLPAGAGALAGMPGCSPRPKRGVLGLHGSHVGPAPDLLPRHHSVPVIKAQ